MARFQLCCKADREVRRSYCRHGYTCRHARSNRARSRHSRTHSSSSHEVRRIFRKHSLSSYYCRTASLSSIPSRQASPTSAYIRPFAPFRLQRPRHYTRRSPTFDKRCSFPFIATGYPFIRSCLSMNRDRYSLFVTRCHRHDTAKHRPQHRFRHEALPKARRCEKTPAARPGLLLQTRPTLLTKNASSCDTPRQGSSAPRCAPSCPWTRSIRRTAGSCKPSREHEPRTLPP